MEDRNDGLPPYRTAENEYGYTFEYKWGGTQRGRSYGFVHSHPTRRETQHIHLRRSGGSGMTNKTLKKTIGYTILVLFAACMAFGLIYKVQTEGIISFLIGLLIGAIVLGFFILALWLID